MTKTPCTQGNKSGGNSDRPFFVPEFTATREEMTGRLLTDHVLSKHIARLAVKNHGTVPLTTDGVEDRLRLLERIASEVRYHTDEYPDNIKKCPKGIKEPCQKIITPYPALLRIDGVEIKARRILFSLGTMDEVGEYFRGNSRYTNPTPVVIGANAVWLYQELSDKEEGDNQKVTSPLFVAV